LFITEAVVNRSRDLIHEITVSLRQEVSHLKYFKITKTWSVKAESEEGAIKQVAANPGEYLESETVTRTEYKKPQQKAGGWANGFKDQLLGANSKR
jgi:hypothetical protein